MKDSEDTAMAVGANNQHDQSIVDIYNEVKTFNEDMESKVDPEKIMDTISIIGYNNKLYFEIQQSLGKRKADINLQSIA